MPEKRLLGNGFPIGKRDMHIFKKKFSTILFFVISTYRNIPLILSQNRETAFMPMLRCPPFLSPAGALQKAHTQQGARLPWHRPLLTARPMAAPIGLYAPRRRNAGRA
ncbi:MAG: hypothetical protein HDR50_07885 [Desulfovibrio sp.]|uniref:hypothetical protein n=1 Tax=Desulfovibrio sp. TaxID=885 RepID=UPI001A7DC43A|nr:hypothetical protein [Desulfovibrio sp.]MBD5417563.1 hypothetical protein [Desulfovibrio sp.]